MCGANGLLDRKGLGGETCGEGRKTGRAVAFSSESVEWTEAALEWAGVEGSEFVGDSMWDWELR
jgi:hypothetical protein